MDFRAIAAQICAQTPRHVILIARCMCTFYMFLTGVLSTQLKKYTRYKPTITVTWPGRRSQPNKVFSWSSVGLAVELFTS